MAKGWRFLEGFMAGAAGALGILLAVFGLLHAGRRREEWPRTGGWRLDLLERFRWLRKLVGKRWFQFAIVVPNLIVLFFAIELGSIPTYILIGLSREDRRASEASVKYFFLGAMAAAIMVYGFSFLYGAAGTMSLRGDCPTVTIPSREVTLHPRFSKRPSSHRVSA